MTVWDEAEQDIADEAELKLSYGEPLNYVEREVLTKLRPELLAPAFDD